MAVRRLVVRAPGRHQQPGPAQQIEQGIAPKANSFGRQRRSHQVVQLACPQPGLAHTLGPDQIQHPFVLDRVRRPTMLPLVMRLPADTHVAASPRYA